MVPYLILCASLLFTFRDHFIHFTESTAKKIQNMVRNHQDHPRPADIISGWLPQSLFATLIILGSIYGGFFGAGLGILILAFIGLTGLRDIHEMNALRTIVGLCANTLPLLIFAMHHVVAWQDTFMMGLGTLLGGYIGAHYFRKLPKKYAHRIIVCIAWSITFYFFSKKCGVW